MCFVDSPRQTLEVDFFVDFSTILPSCSLNTYLYTHSMGLYCLSLYKVHEYFSKMPHFAGIISYDRETLVFPKLCWHNLHNPIGIPVSPELKENKNKGAQCLYQ